MACRSQVAGDETVREVTEDAGDVTSGDETKKRTVAHQWMVTTYETLRAESLQAQGALQNVMQWGLAVAVAAIGAGLALTSGDSSSLSSQDLQLFLFGLVIPWLIFGVSLAWLGEFARMSRAGTYLRWLEQQIASQSTTRATATPEGKSNGNDDEDQEVGWELALAGDRPDLFRASRNWAGYVGSGMIFAGAQLSCAFIFRTLQKTYGRDFTPAGLDVTANITVTVVFFEVFVMWIGMALIAGRMVESLTKHKR